MFRGLLQNFVKNVIVWMKCSSAWKNCSQEERPGAGVRPPG